MKLIEFCIQNVITIQTKVILNFVTYHCPKTIIINIQWFYGDMRCSGIMNGDTQVVKIILGSVEFWQFTTRYGFMQLWLFKR